VRFALVLVVCVLSCGHSPARTEEPLQNTGPPRPPRSKPTFDEAKGAVQELSDAVPYLTDQEGDVQAALELLGSPLWIDGMNYSGVRDDKRATECTQLPSTLVSREQLKQFARCSGVADWRHSGLTGAEGINELTIDHIPSVFAKHRSRLVELASDHRFVYGHFCPAAPGDFWTVVAVTKDGSGRLLVDAILVFNEEEADCRTESF
jgi:hypothetical protein